MNIKNSSCVINAGYGKKISIRVCVWQEPVAFLGGVLAGVLGLNLKEDPLRSWLERTSAEAGVSSRLSHFIFSCTQRFIW